jgi:hypothetical protein
MAGNVLIDSYIANVVVPRNLDSLDNCNLKFTDYKRKYIIKNLWKAGMLSTLLLPATLIMYDCFFNDVWSNLFIKFFGSIYVSLDFSSLILVKGLPQSTVQHHIIVTVAGILNLLADYNVRGYYRSLMIYTYFSVIPFLVNFYLAFRYLSYSDKYRPLVALWCFYIYSVSLIINIGCQLVFFYNEPFSFSILGYLILFSGIFYDDVKLIKFLKNESKISP